MALADKVLSARFDLKVHNNLKSTTLYNCVQQSQSPASQSPRLDSVSEQSLISDLCLQVLPINQTSLYLPGAFKKVMGTFIFFLLSECFFFALHNDGPVSCKVGKW